MGENSKIYDLLLDVKKGNYPDWRYSSYDDLLDDIRFNDKSPGSSIVTIVFEDYEEYFKLFEDLTEDDISQLSRHMLSNHGYGDYDSWSSGDDWSEGYLYNYYFDDVNKEKIDKVANILMKEPNSESELHIMSTISDAFSDYTSSIMGEYNETYERCKLDAIEKEILDEFGNLFSFLGIREVSPLYKYKTSVNGLLKLFKVIGNETQTITELFKSIIKKFNMQKNSDYSDLYYETECHDFDMESFNKNAGYYVDKMLEDAQDSDKYADIAEYLKIKDKINTEFGFNRWNTLKRDSNLRFQILDIDTKTNKLIVHVSTENKAETRSMTYDELMRFDGQHELFNEVRKIKNFFNII